MRGRPRKLGKRAKSGQLSREGQEARVRGSDWVMARKERFGEHYSSALGRAYAAGLLGDGTEAKNRLDAAKRFVRLYQRFIGVSTYTCPLDDSPRGSNVVDLTVSEHQERDHQWLFAAMGAMDVAGVRPYFDQLISITNIDTGPRWLDSLLNGKTDPRDRMVLDVAIRGLDIIAPETPRQKILSAVY